MAVIYPIDVRSSALEKSSNLSSDRTRMTAGRFRRSIMALASFVLFCVTAGVCQAQTHEVVCNAGDGSFEAAFRTGVKVRVAPARNGELATRTCEAALSWDKQKPVIVADALRIDVDALGVDLGMGVPVVTFQVRRSDAECCVSYQIYSLQKPPRLLRTITGGDFFSAEDTDLDGHVEIWTDDLASLDGFENLDVQQLEFAPTLVLRFTKGKLLDVTSEFQPYFDREIAMVRAELKSQELLDFKSSDGILAPPAPSTPESSRRAGYLRGIKSKVLEIVWFYVYSGREQQAWQSLADLWPTADVDRIRAAILKARARGIVAQIDGVSAGVPAGRKEHATIFDGTGGQASNLPAGAAGNLRLPSSMASGVGIGNAPTDKAGLTPPKPIQLWLPSSMGASEHAVIELVIDSAGKVRSATAADNTKWPGDVLTRATAEWKFVPAFKDDQAVAIRVRTSVSLER